MNTLSNSSNQNSSQTESSTNLASIYTVPLNVMIERVDREPKPNYIFPGIKEPSLGFCVGPPKSGKTIEWETFGMCVAAGETEFLGQPISLSNRKVLVFSYEEFYQHRVDRNKKQMRRLIEKHGESWLSNYVVADEQSPRYLATDAHWAQLRLNILAHRPGFVIIDSLTRLYEGAIEESHTATGVMRRLRELVNDCQTTILVIHHTLKQTDAPLTIANVAGSRVVTQEADFIYGMNKTSSGIRYIKPIAFRYANDDVEQVQTFVIEEDLWLKLTSLAYEHDLLKERDGRRNDGNRDLIYDYVVTNTMSSPNAVVSTAELTKAFVDTRVMSKPTMHYSLDALIEAKKILKVAQGRYRALVN